MIYINNTMDTEIDYTSLNECEIMKSEFTNTTVIIKTVIPKEHIKTEIKYTCKDE